MGITISIGDMIRGHANMVSLPASLSQPEGEYFAANIFFTARNGDWTQLLRAAAVNGKWVRATQVRGGFTSLEKEKILCQTIDPDFPRDIKGEYGTDAFATIGAPGPPRCP
jgi:hypothetical protein